MTQIFIFVYNLGNPKLAWQNVPKMQFLQLESRSKMRSLDLVTVLEIFLFCVNNSVEPKQILFNAYK